MSNRRTVVAVVASLLTGLLAALVLLGVTRPQRAVGLVPPPGVESGYDEATADQAAADAEHTHAWGYLSAAGPGNNPEQHPQMIAAAAAYAAGEQWLAAGLARYEIGVNAVGEWGEAEACFCDALDLWAAVSNQEW